MEPKVLLYNNLASTGSCSGRLFSELEVFPVPRLIWDFETLGNNACEPKNKRSVLSNPLIGERFEIERAAITNRSFGSISGINKYSCKGLASQAFFGYSDFKGHSFRFYLPNARFQEENFVGQGHIENVIKASKNGDEWERQGSTEGRFITEPIDDKWEIHLETRQNSLDWLKNNNMNIGTLITTVGNLTSIKSKDEENEDRAITTLREAVERLRTLGLMLSFANGGYIGPLYTEGVYRDIELICAGTVTVSRTTPLEQIGSTWLETESDLATFIRCFAIFERMGEKDIWAQEFDVILSWYFQAIQPQNRQLGKPWPVVANALGAALERLDYILFENELCLGKSEALAKKIERMLDYIGINKTRGYSDINLIRNFVDIRNDATHPKQTGNYTPKERDNTLQKAIQWVEEILLWRIGYEGKYRDRKIHKYSVTDQRYDLSTRNPNW